MEWNSFGACVYLTLEYPTGNGISWQSYSFRKEKDVKGLHSFLWQPEKLRQDNTQTDGVEKQRKWTPQVSAGVRAGKVGEPICDRIGPAHTRRLQRPQGVCSTLQESGKWPRTAGNKTPTGRVTQASAQVSSLRPSTGMLVEMDPMATL